MTKYDEMLDQLISKVNSLSRRGVAAFFLVAAESLLPLYEEFSISEKWGDPSIARNALDLAIKFLTVGGGKPNRRLLVELSKITPHGDDFDSPNSTYAQDALICVDTALRFIVDDSDAQVGCAEYILEPLRTVIAIEQLGVVDPGSSSGEMEWFEKLSNDPRMIGAFEFLEKVVRTLVDENLTVDLIRSLGGEGRAVLQPH